MKSLRCLCFCTDNITIQQFLICHRWVKILALKVPFKESPLTFNVKVTPNNSPKLHSWDVRQCNIVIHPPLQLTHQSLLESSEGLLAQENIHSGCLSVPTTSNVAELSDWVNRYSDCVHSTNDILFMSLLIRSKQIHRSVCWARIQFYPLGWRYIMSRKKNNNRYHTLCHPQHPSV